MDLVVYPVLIWNVINSSGWVYLGGGLHKE